MIDLHSHLLPGLDDGARDLGDALAMAQAMVADGIRVVAATPHVRDDYPTTPALMEARLAEVQAVLDDNGVDLEVLSGGELALDRLAVLDDAALGRFGLGGNPHLLLLEFPYSGWPTELAEQCVQLRETGVVPLVAHPERSLWVQSRPADLDGLVRAGALIQLTAASVDGRLGRATQECALRLVELGLAHIVASDAHGPGVRAVGLSAAATAIGGSLGRWLTEDVPAALLDGADPPPRPLTLRRPGFLQRLRR